MAVGPVTWSEINAYAAATFSSLSVWDKRLIRRMDDAYEAVRLGVKPKPTNVASMKASLRGAIAALQARNAKKGAPE